MEFLANDFVTIYKSEDPKNIYPYTPGIPGVYIASLQKRKRVRLSSRQPMCGAGMTRSIWLWRLLLSNLRTLCRAGGTGN